MRCRASVAAAAIVRAALIAIEAMVGGVDVDADIRVRFGKGANAGDGNHVVALAEMRDHRTSRLLAGGFEDPAAVVRRRAQAKPFSRHAASQVIRPPQQ